jgi:hypothetical protein
MGIFVWGGLGMLVYGLYSLSQADPGPFMNERFTGTLFAFIGACWLVGPILTIRSKLTRQARERRLFSTGRAATAVVTQVEPTGVRINNMPRVRVTLQVEAQDRPPFAHTTSVITPASAMPKPGDVVEVAYDPSNPSDLVVKAREGFEAPMGAVWATRQRRPEVWAKADDGDDDDAALLARLEALRGQGALTDAEFEAAKERLA